MTIIEYDTMLNDATGRWNRLEQLGNKTDLDSQIEFMQIACHSMTFEIQKSILESLKKLKTLTTSESDKIVPEMDTFDPTAQWKGNPPAQCTGRCNVAGVGYSTCLACGWEDNQPFSNQH